MTDDAEGDFPSDRKRPENDRPAASDREPLGRDLPLLVTASFVFYAAFGMSLPVLPLFVSRELGLGDTAVGAVVGAYALAAVLARPFVAIFADRRGRRRLLILGVLITTVGTLGHIAATTLPTLLLLRVIVGVGVGAMMVALTTMAVELAPAERRGEAASYIMMALQFGLGTGPFLGEVMLARSFTAVWIMSGLATASILLLLPLLAAGRGEDEAGAGSTPPGFAALRHGARPGMILALGTVGFVGVLTFLPLFAIEIGLTSSAPAYLATSGTVGLVRLVFARVPDRLGPIVGTTVALSLIAIGMIGMSAWQSPVGLYLSLIPMATGAALLFPSLLLAALIGSRDEDRARIVAGYTVFIDLSAGLAPLVLGAIASVSTYGTAFAASGLSALLGLTLLHVWLAPRILRNDS